MPHGARGVRARSHGGVVLVALVALVGARGASAVGFEPTAQDRGVGVMITQTPLQCFPPPTGCSVIGTPTHYADSDSASDFSAFAATASVPGFTVISATQSSSLSNATLAAEGTGRHESGGGFVAPPNLFQSIASSSDSHFEVAFDVDAPTPYRLAAHVTATGGLSANSAARVRLRTSDDVTLAEVLAATDPECMDSGCSTVGPFPLQQTGVLAPGSYVLEASTAGSAAPFFFAGNFFALASTGAYEVQLSVTAVPTLGPGGWSLLALMLGISAAPFVRLDTRMRRAGL
jgi:hypothetical protein